MSEDIKHETVQLNLAPIQRNAGRDFNEYFVPGSVKLFLATSYKDELDALALDNSVLFRHRFGFEPSTKVRKQVLDIKNQYDLTDREIRSIHRAGHLVVAKQEARIKPDRMMPLAGWIQLVPVILLYLSVGIQIAFSTAPTWKQGLGEAALIGIGLGVLWLLNAFYIAPWYTLKRSGLVA